MKGKNLLGLIAALLVIVGTIFVAAEGIGSSNIGGIEHINLGLDLAGGVSITYTTAKDNPTSEEINDTIYKLQKRTDEKGYTEAEIYREGNDRINVDIPGVSDANTVLQELGKPGNLEFIDEAGTVVLTGADIKSANPDKDSSGLGTGYIVKLEMTPEGTVKFREATQANLGKIIYILYNNEVLVEPRVSSVIDSGNAQITGMANYEQASNLASNIRIGALPLELVELRSNVVGAKMGQEAVDSSVKAGIIGILIIIAFMILYYRLPGLVAAVALAFYAGLTISVFSLLGLTLTLPGVAGIILSIGMAVDANVIIFSRIKEEIGMEKTLRASVISGFRKATSAILDGNVTTLIAAVVLFVMGSGTIKGFAQTLGLGILISMFTALVVTRILLMAVVGVGIRNKVLYGVDKGHKVINVLDRRKLWFAISGAIIAIGIIAMPVHLVTDGSILNFDVEFVGGTSTLVTIGEDRAYASYEALESDVKDLVVEATGSLTPQFSNVKGQGQFIIKTVALNTDTRIVLEQALIEKYGITSEDIISESISPTISNEMRRDAIIAVVLASVFILLYVTFRFKDVRFGVSAVLALVHDVLIVLAVYSVLRVPVNNSFIAAMLTIVGYSINDTIVVFDRVRENQKHMKRGDYKGVINRSISETLSRSINTSLTTFVMVFILYIFGVSSIREFALPLMVGIIAGTYSSVFIASPLWYIFKRKEEAMILSAHQKEATK